jgi:hypothetical protein
MQAELNGHFGASKSVIGERIAAPANCTNQAKTGTCRRAIDQRTADRLAEQIVDLK